MTTWNSVSAVGDEYLIRVALQAAATAGPRDVPMGAVVFSADGVELARAVNAREALGDPTAHAEILALRAAASVFGDGWRLVGTHAGGDGGAVHDVRGRGR